MKNVLIDRSKCLGCGVCVSIAPKSFKMVAVGDEDKSVPIVPSGDDEKAIQGAINCCPAQAISLSLTKKHEKNKIEVKL